MRREIPMPAQGPFTVLLALLTALTALSIDMSLPALPELEKGFHATTAAVQLTLSVFLIGFALGQLICGPVSDRYGRRAVLLPGIGLFAVAGLFCAVSPSLETLIAARFFQGMGASVGPILARAIVRDKYEGHEAAGIMSQMTQIMIIAPLLAPSIGAYMLGVLGWHSIFFVLAFAGTAVWVLCWKYLPETAPKSDPDVSQWQQVAQGYRAVFTHGPSLRYLLVTCFAYSGMFSYVSGSPFIFIEGFGVSQQMFGILFALVAGCLMVGATVNRSLLKRYEPGEILQQGMGVVFAAGLVLLAAVWLRIGGVWGVVVPMMGYLFGVGLVMPNATTAAMAPHGKVAGVVSSVMGGLQTLGGALAGYCVSLFYDKTPMSLGIAVAVLGTLAFVFLDRTPVGNSAQENEAEGELRLAAEA